MLKFAIVGCGRIAKRYVDLFSTKAIDGAGLVAVADIVSEKAARYAEIAKVKAYTDYKEMMTKENPKLSSSESILWKECRTPLQSGLLLSVDSIPPKKVGSNSQFYGFENYNLASRDAEVGIIAQQVDGVARLSTGPTEDQVLFLVRKKP